MIALKDLRELLKTEKFIKFALIVGTALIALTAFSGIFGSKSSAAVQKSDISALEGALEKRLSDVLKNVEGVGNADIMVTLDCSEQTEYAGGKDMPSTVRTPRVRGVIVVCDGGSDIVVREKVINAVAGVFGISTTRVSVIK